MITETGTSNKIDTLDQLQGEVVSGVLIGRTGYVYVIFESGYSLIFTGSFWLESPDNTSIELQNLTDAAQAAVDHLDKLKKLAIPVKQVVDNGT